jgi:iron complex transport system substrate-binding protein
MTAARLARAAILLAGLAVFAAPGRAAERPARVVSVHLCADQLVLRLADRDQIAAITYLARDPGQSYMADQARGIPVTNGLAEQVIALKPDLVLAGAFSARTTVRILRRLGIRVLDLPEPTDFAQIRGLIRTVAGALGQAARGEALIAAMDRRLAAVPRPDPAARKLAVNYQPSGYTNGPGTLEHAVLAAAGLRNLADQLGFGATGQITLETLIAAAPDVVLFNAVADDGPSLGRNLIRHPAFRHIAGRARILTPPRRLWACGSWFTAEAVDWLRRNVSDAAGAAAPGPKP